MSEHSTNPPDIVGATITIGAMNALRLAVAELMEVLNHQAVILEQHASVAGEFANVSQAWSESRMQDALDGTRAAIDGLSDMPKLYARSSDALVTAAKHIGVAAAMLEVARCRQLP